jgi:hypothetical protein
MMMLLPGCTSAHEYIIQNERGFLADLIGWIFDDMLKYILFTPFDLFQSATAVSVVMKMGVVSGGAMIVLSLVEGIKRTLSMKYTPMGTIMMRYPIALAVAGFAPALFYYAGMSVNGLVSLVGTLANANIGGHGVYASKLQAMSGSIYEAFMTFLFMLVLLGYLMKAFLQHAARWFGLLVNCVTAPIVMLSYVFKSYDHIAKAWLADTIHRFSSQVYHSFFLSLIAVILYTPNLLPTGGASGTWDSMFVRLMLSVGGLHFMMHPPAWLKNSTSSEDPREMMKTVGKLTKLLSKRRK